LVALVLSVGCERCRRGLSDGACADSVDHGDPFDGRRACRRDVAEERDFKPEDFAELHPGGALGRRLLTRVSDVMHTGDALPLVSMNTQMRDVLATMTQKEVRGVAGVLDEKNQLIGIVTDGDLRRRLEKSLEPAGR
jgi:CBS-domain-containing membrane protein